jgi:group II intron reverse transcriptase/maturase
MTNKLAVIAKIAKQDKEARLTTLMHLISKENLKESFKLLRKNAAVGIDEVTVKTYEINLDTNLENLMHRLRGKWYKPKAVRRVYIPKQGKKEQRPLGIPAVEDKIVQMTLKRILVAIYEQDFLNCSYGFRPNKSCIDAIRQLNESVMKHPVNYVVEVDIRNFFGAVNHGKLLSLISKRIADPNIIWLIRKFLEAGIMEEGRWLPSDEGVPQGGIVSPVLANIYLHYVLDTWFEEEFRTKIKGYVRLMRYADDYLAVFESKLEADRFMQEQAKRLAMFDLEISKEKTTTIKFGKQVWKQAQREGVKSATFDFLGFTHYGGKTRKGWIAMGHKTSRKRLNAKIKSNNSWLKSIRNLMPLKEILEIVKAKLIGHYNYFGVNGNFRSLKQYYWATVKMLFKWVNRRSQRKSYNWEQFNRFLDWNPLPKTRICREIWY